MLRDIPSSALRQLVRLSERKEALMAQIQDIDRKMMRVQNKFGIPSREGDQPAPVSVSRTPGGPLRRPAGRARPGSRWRLGGTAGGCTRSAAAGPPRAGRQSPAGCTRRTAGLWLRRCTFRYHEKRLPQSMSSILFFPSSRPDLYRTLTVSRASNSGALDRAKTVP